MAEPTFEKMSAMHFAGWKMGLKTGMYYLRSRPAVDAVKFSVDLDELVKAAGGKSNIDVLKAMNTDSVQVKADGKTYVKVKKARSAKEAGFENSNPKNNNESSGDAECIMCGS